MKKKLMQSYDVWEQIPRKCANSSPTCVDKRTNYGQIGNNSKKVVQRDVTFLFLAYYFNKK